MEILILFIKLVDVLAIEIYSQETTMISLAAVKLITRLTVYQKLVNRLFAEVARAWTRKTLLGNIILPASEIFLSY